MLDDELAQSFEAAGLGGRDGASFRLSELGEKCGDAAREYRFWCQRDRQLHAEGSHPVLTLDEFRGRRVLEIGPGWGCNLFRLAPVATTLRGLEIEPVYVRFAAMFAGLEGVEVPRIDLGSAESLPYADASFDRVLCFGSLEYTDLRVALAEVTRVLAPGGRLIATVPVFGRVLVNLSESWRDSAGLRYHATTLLNTLAYAVAARRVRGVVEGRSTARPVYLWQGRLEAFVREAGLVVARDLTCDTAHTLTLVADKP